MNPYYCPALWVLRGTTYDQDAAGRLTPRDPEHRIDPATGRCAYCHTTLAKTTPKEIP